MNNTLRIIIGFLIFIGLTATSVRAQQIGQLPIPVFQNVQIQSQVAFDAGAGLYTYSYTISNPASNTGEIWSIDIDITQPTNSVNLSSQGLTIGGDRIVVTFAEKIVDFKGSNVPMVPVGISAAGGWAGGIGRRGVAGFSSGDAATNILPGQTQSGFEFITRGLPTIREIEIEPWWIYVSEGPATKEGTKQAREIEKNITFKTKTLGPTAPPADFKATSFIDYIISMKHEAFSLGWITNKGIENSLDAKLENAKMEIMQGNNNTAKNILEAFINEVEAQKDKHLTSEAYGLLKYNVEYLIGRL